MAEEVLVTGGAGYVGGILVPRLLNEGYKVKVLDLFIYGDLALNAVKDHPNLKQIRGDIRDQEILKAELPGCSSVIHLACISNDPSFELNPDLSRTINFDAFGPLVKISKESGIKRFIYASTSSVYGVSEADNVTEDHPLVPLTDYNKYKGLCEPILLQEQSTGFTTVVVRPATICGYSPRQRLDLTVNILTNHAVNLRKINVFGGEQMRPNIHIEDVVDLYLMLLNVPQQKIAGQIFNAGYQNHKVKEIAEIVNDVIVEQLPQSRPIDIITTPSDDNRSYHISSEKIKRELGFVPSRTIQNGVLDLIRAFTGNRLPGSMDDSHYYNIKKMQEVKLK